MGRIVIGLVVLVLAAVLYLQIRDDAAAGIRECMTKAGATIQESERFEQAFPYLEAASTGERVKDHPELDGAKTYAVKSGEAQALLFVGKSQSDAQAFERTLRGLGWSLADAHSRRAGSVLLLWLKPPARAFDPVGDCVR
jgi:hypothetical protein